jgi:hypothetical protein
MPVFDFVLWDQQQGGTLERDGPIIPVEVSMPAALEEWYVKHNFPVPPPIVGYALIDTGASISGIHEPILEQLSIIPFDSIPLVTPSGTGRAFVYPTRVSFPALNVQGYTINRVVGSQLNWKTGDGKDVIMLLGRDILAQFLLVYNGKFNLFTLAF